MKIFVLLSRFPYPLEKGDKLRAFHQIKELSKNNEIILCALSDIKVMQSHTDSLKKYCSHIEIIYLSKIEIYWNLIRQLLFTNEPLQVAYFYNQSAHLKITKLLEKYQPDHLYCQLIRVAKYAQGLKIKKTLDYMDAFSKGMDRRINNAPFYLKYFLRIEATRLKHYEHFIFDEFNNHTIISEQDKNLIANINNKDIKIVLNGVDFSHYKYREVAKEYDLIFTGNMAYPPNVDSVIFLTNHILPLLLEKLPNVKLVIAGANPDKKVLNLKSNNVEVTGWVNDIADYYAKSKVFIAPMQIGTGLQNKLLEAMAMKIPCITSQLANNALGATHNENILIANQPLEYVKHILNLLNDKVLCLNIAEKGYDFVKSNYTWEGSTSTLEKLINSAN